MYNQNVAILINYGIKHGIPVGQRAAYRAFNGSRVCDFDVGEGETAGVLLFGGRTDGVFGYTKIEERDRVLRLFGCIQ